MIKVLARIFTAVVGIPVIILLALEGGYPFFLLILSLALMGLYEYYWLTNLPQLLRHWGYLISALLLITINRQQFRYSWLVFAGGIILLLSAMLFGFDQYNFGQAGAALLGVCYIPLFLSCLLLIRSLPLGRRLTIMVFILTWITDTLAFFVGSRFGRRRLMAKISPQKTWAGAWAGLAGSVTAAFWAAPYVDLEPTAAIFTGVTTGIAAVLGDLIESALKRLAGVKDSGTILPGHGGILDRFDALLLVAPTAYFVLSWWYSRGG